MTYMGTNQAEQLLADLLPDDVDMLAPRTIARIVAAAEQNRTLDEVFSAPDPHGRPLGFGEAILNIYIAIKLFNDANAFGRNVTAWYAHLRTLRSLPAPAAPPSLPGATASSTTQTEYNAPTSPDGTHRQDRESTPPTEAIIRKLTSRLEELCKEHRLSEADQARICTRLRERLTNPQEPRSAEQILADTSTTQSTDTLTDSSTGER